MMQKRIYFKRLDNSAAIALYPNVKLPARELAQAGYSRCSLKEYRKLKAVQAFELVELPKRGDE